MLSVRNLSLVVGLAVIASWWSLASAEAPQPPKLSTLMSADDLAASAKQYVEELDKATADEKAFTTNGDKIAQDANTLAVVALVLAKHDSDGASKSIGAAMIAPAQKLAKAKDLATAREAVTALKAALEGKAPSVPEPEWGKVASMGKIMKQVETINTKLRVSLGRLDPRRADANVRAATIMAAVGQAIIYDTHEVKDPNDLPKWYALSAEMRDASSELSRAIRGGDKEAATAASAKVLKSCDTCHEAFQ